MKMNKLADTLLGLTEIELAELSNILLCTTPLRVNKVIEHLSYNMIKDDSEYTDEIASDSHIITDKDNEISELKDQINHLEDQLRINNLERQLKELGN